MSRRPSTVLALVVLGVATALALGAPATLPEADLSRAYLPPWSAPPFGTDQRGRPLLATLAQGAAVIVGPSLLAGVLVALAATAGGIARCLGRPWLDAALHFVGEVVGSLPRLVVVLVAALLLPGGARTLTPLALVWAALCAPGAIDEAGAVAERLGGARFVEALRAHGFGWARVFLVHVAAWNLRPVVVRQGAEVALQVAFLEIALSYLAEADDQPSLTHSERVRSWADLLTMGYPSLVLDVPTGHALALGVGAMALLVVGSQAAVRAARPR